MHSRLKLWTAVIVPWHSNSGSRAHSSGACCAPRSTAAVSSVVQAMAASYSNPDRGPIAVHLHRLYA